MHDDAFSEFDRQHEKRPTWHAWLIVACIAVPVVVYVICAVFAMAVA